MNTQYTAQVITLSKHMDELARVEDISYEHPTHGKKLLALYNAMTALTKLHNKTIEQVYEDISDYASWMSLQTCIMSPDGLTNDPVVIAA
jgi:uncharacterized protein YktA (UPF0223 family)